MISITCESEPELIPPQSSIVRHIALQVLKDQRIKHGTISFIFASDDILLRLKLEFFKKDYFTDVITFSLNGYDKSFIEGEIYISLPRALENSKVYNQSYEEEVSRLIIHGCLHLVGYNDKSEEEKEVMTKMEEKYLDKIDSKRLFTSSG